MQPPRAVGFCFVGRNDAANRFQGSGPLGRECVPVDAGTPERSSHALRQSRQPRTLGVGVGFRSGPARQKGTIIGVYPDPSKDLVL